MAVITSSVVKITFEVTKSTFSVVYISLLVSKITFAMAEIIFKTAVIFSGEDHFCSSSQYKLTFVMTDITLQWLAWVCLWPRSDL